MDSFPILYRDEHYIAIHKPAGLLVHRSYISEDKRFLLQLLRNQIGQWVYPIHRLDRPTSGVIIFGLSSDAARQLVAEFELRRVVKKYIAVVRGYADEEGVIDYPLLEEEGKERQEAVTHYRRLATVELPIAVGRYPQSRYSLIELEPQTGRMHQIRKHMKHIFHPIVGDTTHGDGKHNQMFRDHFNSHRLLLMAAALQFRHPFSGELMQIETAPDPALQALFGKIGWEEWCDYRAFSREEAGVD
ncbi:MAG: pseudouridine synthase [Chromatiales bacterium]|nr:pseudouridine synthase [Chromatiales bacterium]